MSRIHILPAKLYSKLPDGFLSFKCVPENRFHGESSPVFLKAKFENISKHLQGSEFTIDNVQSFNYRERYTVSDTSGNKYVMDGTYASSGKFKDFRIVSSTRDADYLLSLVNMPDDCCIGCDYTPSCVALEQLNGMMKVVCDGNEFVILNVLEKICNYKVQYILRDGKYIFYVDFSVDKDMNITAMQVMLASGMDISVAERIALAFQ